MRILRIIRSVNPVGGGPIEAVRQSSRLHVEAGHRVEVVCLDDPSSPWLKDFPLPCHALGPVQGKFGYSPLLVSWLEEHLGNYDCAVIEGLWQYHSWGAWRALRKSKTPYLVFTHGMLDPWFKRTFPLKHLKKWLYWPWADYRVLRDAAAVLFTCEEERRLARDSFWLYRAREVVVKFGTLGVPEPTKDYASGFLAKRPELNGFRRFVFLGRVHPKKSPDIIIRTIARLKEKGYWIEQGARSEELRAKGYERVAKSSEPRAGGSELIAQGSELIAHAAERRHGMKLIMAGPADGDYAAELQALARQLGVEESIVWTGMITGDDKWGALQCGEAFVLPSHQENFGIAVAESLSVGVPVLISKSVNIWADIVADGAGTADDDTVEGFERQVIAWLKMSSDDVAVMRRKARACFDKRYTAKCAAESLLGVMERVVGEPRKTAVPHAV
jgi:glycosyltransferase involved in cell wall biosynthesis